MFIFILAFYLIGVTKSSDKKWYDILVIVFKAVFYFVVLKPDKSVIQVFLDESILYNVIFYVNFGIVLVNAFIFVVSLLGYKIKNWFKLFITFMFPKNEKIVFYIGDNYKSIKSIIKTSRSKNIIIFDRNSNELDKMIEYCYSNNIMFFKTSKLNECEYIESRLNSKFDKANVTVIICYKTDSKKSDDDANALIQSKKFSDLILKNDLNKFDFKVYVFGKRQNESAFVYFVEKTNGTIVYLNNCKLIALDYINQYPITKFMDENHIDYEKALVKENLDVNVLLIGFGHINEEVFKVSIANNQLMMEKDGQIAQKLINYFVYDRENTRKDKNLNHTYYRYENEFLENISCDYLPLPEKAASVYHVNKDVNEPDFYKSVKNNLEFGENNSKYNYIIIAIGSDLDNIDMAEKLVIKLQEWDLVNSTKVFVKVDNHDLIKNDIFKEHEEKGEFYLFGDEGVAAYNINAIVNEPIEKISKLRNLTYTLENELTYIADSSKEVFEKRLDIINRDFNILSDYSNLVWYEKTQFERDSNLYASLR